MMEVTINISLASGGDGSCRWVGGGGGEWLAGRGGGWGGVCERSHIYLTHIGDSMVRVTRLGPISEKDVTRRTVGFSTYNCER